MSGQVHPSTPLSQASAVPAEPIVSPKAFPVTADLPASEPTQLPLTLREVLAVAALVGLADTTIYRGNGYAGLALFLFVTPFLLLCGSPRPRLRAGFWIVGTMTLLLAARMVWLGSWFSTSVGGVLLIGVSLAVLGRSPCLLDMGLQALTTFVAGLVGLVHYIQSAARVLPGLPRVRWLNYALPLTALVIFGGLFVLANPDLVTSFTTLVDTIFRSVAQWLERLGEYWLDLFFWMATAWCAVGLLRPLWTNSLLASWLASSPANSGEAAACGPAPMYGAIRNTLLAVSGLFAIYLVFEFRTLWFREFPEGFQYSGYAHEGAAWLTAALALATLVLSITFRGQLLRDPRISRLRGLAWLWSALNFVLALTVYHRLFIYIDFNGMTRMRVVGLLGISAVVVGFALVLLKILFDRDFVWLLRRQLWTVAVAVYLFALLPVDTLVHRYNVRQILAGRPAPSVQISVHRNSAEGVLVLRPLVECEDPLIRDGVRALLAERALNAEAAARREAELGWTAFQIADRVLRQRLADCETNWEEYRDDAKRAEALARFHEYAYQWY